MTVEQQGCGDCNDQDVINTGDGAGADVIMMTGPLGDVFTKALAVYLNKKPIEGYNTTEVATESQSQDAMLASAVVSDIVRDNLESVKNMVSVATAEDANVVPTAIAYVVPAQKVTNPETVITVQNAAKACKMASRDFIFVVDAFKKDSVYSDFNTVVVPGDKDDKINFYNACKGFQRATESLYGPDVQVVVGFEQLSQYMVSRYKLKMSREEIQEQLSAPEVQELTQEEPEQEVATEGIMDFFKKVFGPKKKEPVPTPEKSNLEKLKEAVDNIAPGKHSVNNVHLYKGNNLLATLQHKEKQVNAYVASTQRHLQATKHAVALAIKTFGQDHNDFDAGKAAKEFDKFEMPKADLALFGSDGANKQNQEGDYVRLKCAAQSAGDIPYYEVTYHVAKGGTTEVDIRDSDVAKIKSIIQNIIKAVETVPTNENKQYSTILNTIPKDLFEFIECDGNDYESGNEFFDFAYDLMNDYYQGHVQIDIDDSVDSIAGILLNLTKSLEGDVVAEEGFKEWLGSFFKGKQIPQEKPKAKESEEMIDRLMIAKKKLETRLESSNGEVSLNLQAGNAKSADEIKKLAQWFVSILGSHKSIIETSIDCMNENAKSYLPVFELLAKGEYTYQDFVKLEKPLALKQKAIFDKMIKAYKGMNHVKVGKNNNALEAPYRAFSLNIPWTDSGFLRFDEDDFEDGERPFFIVTDSPWPYGDRQFEYNEVNVTLSEADYKSIGLSLMLAIDEAIKIEKTAAMQDATGVDADLINKLCEIEEDSCHEIIKQYYKMHYLSGLYAIADRLVVLSNQFTK